MARVAPLVAALGGEVTGLTPREVLSDATKLAGSVRELSRTFGADVATVEFGSRWDLEAAGATLDWSSFPPAVRGLPSGEPTGGRAPALLDALTRVKAELAGRAVAAASVTGPVAAGDDVALAAKRCLVAVRALCEAGAGLIWIAEEGGRPPADAAALARAMTPVLGTARFYRAEAALHLPGAADGWLEAVRVLRQVIPCFDPERSPALGRELAGGRRRFGVLVAPESRPAPLAHDPACVLVAHDGELAGRVAPRDLQAAVQALRL
jgi:hypothetical protein